MTPFLSSALCDNSSDSRGVQSEVILKTLALSLDKGGACINDTDPRGLAFLHLFFGRFNLGPSDQDWKDALIYLVLRGADVYAKDERGTSVSHIAYSRLCREWEPQSYRGDLWDAVLDACGHDVREFRKGYPRTALYTADYSRRDFEALWEGREERCPYWDDADWSIPDNESSGRLKDDQDTDSEIICLCFGGVCFYRRDDSSETTDSQSWSEGNESDVEIGGVELTHGSLSGVE